MTRDEQIKKALNMFAPSSWDIDRGKAEQMTFYEKVASHVGFFEGAKWADDNPKPGLIDLSQVWHPAEEDPEPNRTILAQNGKRSYITLKRPYQDSEWESLKYKLILGRWAYIDDLLPKGGKS